MRKAPTLALVFLFAASAVALAVTDAAAQPRVRRGREIVLSSDYYDITATQGKLSASGLRMPAGARVVRVTPDAMLAVVSIAQPGRGRIGERIPANEAKINWFCNNIVALNPRISLVCEGNYIVRFRDGLSGPQSLLESR